MGMITHTFESVKRSADYTVPCSECGKVLHRKASVEHTINPFNRNPDGSIRTRAEVSARAMEEALKEAAVLASKSTKCRNCEDAPNRSLLLQMSAEPDRHFPRPDNFWNSPMHFLSDRKHVREDFEQNGEDWKSIGWIITDAGKKRALSLREGEKG